MYLDCTCVLLSCLLVLLDFDRYLLFIISTKSFISSKRTCYVSDEDDYYEFDNAQEEARER